MDFISDQKNPPLASQAAPFFKGGVWGICVIIHQAIHTEDALDFILGASNVTENILVIFIKQGVNHINKFKSLKGFEIHRIYAEEESIREYNIDLTQCTLTPQIISHQAIKHYVTHCQQIFAF